MTDDSLSTPEGERRRYFRIDDEVGLKLAAIAAADEAAAILTYQDISARVGLLNELRELRYEHLPQQRSVENKFPTIATYLRIIERQIDILAMAVDDRDDFPRKPNQRVNLSAQGLSLMTDAAFAMGTLIEVKMALFPDHCRIEALARVVRSDAESPSGELALEFTHLRDADREALIRHVYLLQRQRLQARIQD